MAVPYAELHCHSNASFLDGGSHPEELAEEAARLGLEALALTDHDGMYGIVRFAEAWPLALPPEPARLRPRTPAAGPGAWKPGGVNGPGVNRGRGPGRRIRRGSIWWCWRVTPRDTRGCAG
jgi:hypothetical protein